MEIFRLNTQEDYENFLRYKASVKGHQPYQLHASVINNIRNKVDEYLKSVVMVHDDILDKVDISTQNEFYDKKIDSMEDSMVDYEERKNEVIDKYGMDAKTYIEHIDEIITELQDKKFYYKSAKEHPNVVSMFTLPKLVFMQWEKNLDKKLKKVDIVLEDIIDKMPKEKLIKLYEMLSEKFDGVDKEWDNDFPPVSEFDHFENDNVEITVKDSEDDFIEEVGPIRR